MELVFTSSLRSLEDRILLIALSMRAAVSLAAFRAFLSEVLDLLGYDREASADLARARGFDGGVQSENVRLERDVVDNLDYFFDLFTFFGNVQDRFAELVDARDGIHRLAIGRIHKGFAFADAVGVGLDDGLELLERGGHFLDG
jgi:hypothetical protein